jgi:hypothetical protein
MDTWEYMTVEKVDTVNLEKTLNDLGEQGWEAVGILQSSSRSYVVLLKRRKQ